MIGFGFELHLLMFSNLLSLNDLRMLCQLHHDFLFILRFRQHILDAILAEIDRIRYGGMKYPVTIMRW